MYTKKSIGPSTDPCGTPDLTILLDDRLLDTRTHWFLFIRKLLIQESNFPDTFALLNFCRSIDWSTRLNAFAKSRYKS